MLVTVKKPGANAPAKSKENEVISYPNKSFFLSQVLSVLSPREPTGQSEHLDQFKDSGVAICLPSPARRGSGRSG